MNILKLTCYLVSRAASYLTHYSIIVSGLLFDRFCRHMKKETEDGNAHEPCWGNKQYCLGSSNVNWNFGGRPVFNGWLEIPYHSENWFWLCSALERADTGQG